MKYYIAFISGGGQCSSVVFPDFPGCVSAGNGFEDALRMAHEALAGHTACMREAHLDIPEPSTLEQIKERWEDWNDWRHTDYLAALVALPPARETSPSRELRTRRAGTLPEAPDESPQTAD